MFETSLYIHVPFCIKKCHYCDFVSFSNEWEIVESYFDAIEKELFYIFDNKKSLIKSIYIGGGTPSSIDAKYVLKLLKYINEISEIAEDAEISIEANPGTITLEKILMFKEAGINRISFGLQAWQNRILKLLGRIHSLEEFLESYKLAKSNGYNNINIDLIFGIPTQSLEEWKETLRNVMIIQPKHISAYSLKIEEGTYFYQMKEKNVFPDIDEEIDREMYDYTIKTLKDNGYIHYEISNFSKQGYESLHNKVYWELENYIGLGCAAHSFVDGIRSANFENINKYIDTCINGKFEKEQILLVDKNEQMKEFMMLGFRKIGGIKRDSFFERFEIDLFGIFGEIIFSLQEKGLVEVDEENVKLSRKGLDLANLVFMEFI